MGIRKENDNKKRWSCGSPNVEGRGRGVKARGRKWKISRGTGIKGIWTSE